MMCVRERLRSERGATYIMVLLFFLVVAMVSAVVLLAASTNSERTYRYQQQEQAYLTLASSAQLLADDLSQQMPTITSSEVVKTYTCPYKDDTATHADAGIQTSSTTVTDAMGNALEDTPLMQMMKTGMGQILAGATSYTRSFSMESDGLDTINGVFTMDASYNVTITLQSTSENYRYSMKLTAKATAGVPTTSTTVSEGADTHQGEWVWSDYYQAWADYYKTNNPYYYWNTYLPWAIAANDPRIGSYSTAAYDVKTTTSSNSVTWAAPTIEKGGE